MVKKIIFILTISLFFCHTAYTESEKLDNISQWFSGEYSTSEQAVKNSQIRNISLHVKKFSINNQKGLWYYLEFVSTDSIAKPFRQEVYHIHIEKFDFIYIDRYSILDSNRVIGAFQNDSLLEKISFDQLTHKVNCSVLLNKYDDTFAGTTSGKACSSKLNGAHYSTTDIEITKADFFLWEKGFNLRKQQVWGPTDNGYVFKKINKHK